MNPLYRNISIDDSPAMREALNSITSQLLLTADVMEEEIEIMNEIIAVTPNATDIPAGETTESAETQELVELIPTIFVCIEIYPGCCEP